MYDGWENTLFECRYFVANLDCWIAVNNIGSERFVGVCLLVVRGQVRGCV